MNNPIFRFSVPFMKIESDMIKNLSRIIIDKEGVFPFFAPKEFSLMVNDRLLGDCWKFTPKFLNKKNANICFINHNPQLVKYSDNGFVLMLMRGFLKNIWLNFILNVYRSVAI